MSDLKNIQKRRTHILTLILYYKKVLVSATKGLNITTLTHLNQIDTTYNCTVIHAQELDEKCCTLDPSFWIKKHHVLEVNSRLSL